MAEGKTTLYLGLDPSHYCPTGQLHHLPLIEIVPTPLEKVREVLGQFDQFTHVLFTSKTTVSLLCSYLDALGHLNWNGKTVAAIGEATAATLRTKGIEPTIIAREETSEGVVEVCRPFFSDETHVFWPHSALSRSVIRDHFIRCKIPFTECHLYTSAPILLTPPPCLELYDELVFTSPSVVDAFLINYQSLPKNKILTTIGPITEQHLRKFL